MEKIREIIAYKNYFGDFLIKQPIKVQDKIFKILKAIETLERIPTTYLKLIPETKGLYEARIQLGRDIWRVVRFFDKGKHVILLNGFQKKTRKDDNNPERDAESFKIGLLLKKAKESRHMTQEELVQIIDKKRTFISRVGCLYINKPEEIDLKVLQEIIDASLHLK